jgi:hypothetical protein
MRSSGLSARGCLQSRCVGGPCSNTRCDQARSRECSSGRSMVVPSPSPHYAEGHAEKAVDAKRYAIVAWAHMRVTRQRFLGKPPAAKVSSSRRSYYTRRSHRLAVARPARRLGPCAPRSWLQCGSRCAKVRPGGPTGRRPSFELNVSPRRRARVASCRSRRRVAAASAGGTA